MKFYGVRGRTNTWIQSFLADRSQIVVLDGAQSYQANFKSGVPQGSVLGTCLFLFYINDLPNTLRSEVRLFADDTVVYLSVDLQQDLEKLEKWEKKWGLEFHPGKCQVLTFTRRRIPVYFEIQTVWTRLGECEDHKVPVDYVPK